jgi:hypothetical protein
MSDKSYNLYDLCIEDFEKARSWAELMGEKQLQLTLLGILFKLRNESSEHEERIFNKFHGDEE